MILMASVEEGFTLAWLLQLNKAMNEPYSPAQRLVGGNPPLRGHSYIVSSWLYNGPELQQRVHQEED